jgi:O-antigen/teichoic acid export membrane protein
MSGIARRVTGSEVIVQSGFPPRARGTIAPMTGSRQREDGSPPHADELSAGEVKARAVHGVMTVGMRGVAIRVVGFAGNVALARLLVPEQFGVLALGFTFVVFANFVTDGGIGAQLIRARTTPSRRQFEAIVALQLGLATAIVVLTAAIGVPIGTTGAVAAIMACSLPIDALRAPAALMAERRLDYGALVRAEVVEIIAYNLVAIGAVVLGAGVWGVAGAVVVRALVGTGLIVATLEPHLVRPRWSWATVRPLLGFGLRFQSVNLISLVRDQGLIVVTGAIAGLTTLGYWSLAYRIVQVVLLVLESLRRVSYPAIARLIAAQEELGPTLQRALRVTAIMTGAAVAVLIGAAPALIPFVFGERWEPAVSAVAWSAAGLMIAGPMSTICAGLLSARGRLDQVLRVTVTHTVVWFAVSAPLLPGLGVKALGIGWCVSASIDLVLLTRYARRQVRLDVVAGMARPVVAVAAGAATGWWVAQTVPGALVASAAALATSIAIYLLTLAILAPHDLREAFAIVRRGMRRAPAGGARRVVAERP